MDKKRKNMHVGCCKELKTFISLFNQNHAVGVYKINGAYSCLPFVFYYFVVNSIILFI